MCFYSENAEPVDDDVGVSLHLLGGKIILPDFTLAMILGREGETLTEVI
jgi:hypothetical protein